jgi:hypothetical protein
MKSQFRFWVMIVAVAATMGCGLVSQVQDALNIPPTPSMDNVPTGSSPMSGDWHSDTEWGYFAFTIDPDGTMVTTAVFKVSNWTCGGTTLTTQLQSLSQWPLSDGQFGGMVTLNGSFHTMTVVGAYEESRGQFTGEWEQDAHGSHCSGTWETIPRK